MISKTTNLSIEILNRIIPSKNQELWNAYIRWIKLLSYRGLHIKHHSEKYFNLLYRSVSRNWSKKLTLGYLQSEFIKENLSLSLLLEPLDGFEWLSKNRYPLEFSKSLPILLQIIMPLSRMIAVLNQQNPMVYQPLANLLCAYLEIYIKHNPQWIEKLKEVSISVDMSKIEQDLLSTHNEVKQVLYVARGWRFKIKTAYYLGLLKILIRKNENRIIFLDYVNAFLYSLWYTLTIKGRPLKTNQI